MTKRWPHTKRPRNRELYLVLETVFGMQGAAQSGKDDAALGAVLASKLGYWNKTAEDLR